MRLVAITPVGKFVSVLLTKEQADESLSFVKQMLDEGENVNSFNIHTDEGKVYLAKHLFLNSAFYIQD